MKIDFSRMHWKEYKNSVARTAPSVPVMGTGYRIHTVRSRDEEKTKPLIQHKFKKTGLLTMPT